MSNLKEETIKATIPAVREAVLNDPPFVRDVAVAAGLPTMQDLEAEAEQRQQQEQSQEERLQALEGGLQSSNETQEQNYATFNTALSTESDRAKGVENGLQTSKADKSDPRFSDARTPLPHTHPASEVTGLANIAKTGAYSDLTGVPDATTTGKGVTWFAGDGAATAGRAVQATDTRLSNSRTPTSHAATHATGGSDAITPAAIGAATATHTHDYTTLTNRPALGGAAALSVGTTAGTVAAGDDTRFTNARTPTGAAGGDLTGTYPNPTLAPVTISDATTPTGDTGTVTGILGFLASTVKAITGKTSWRTAPAITLEGAAGHVASTSNPHSTTAAQVGLGNVNNTSDANKPISTATQAALDQKAGTAVATQTANGLMSATDKTKLDGLGIRTMTGGTVNTPAITALAAVDVVITLNAAMPDTNYVTFPTIDGGAVGKLSAAVKSKTTTTVTVTLTPTALLTVGAGTVSVLAWKFA